MNLQFKKKSYLSPNVLLFILISNDYTNKVINIICIKSSFNTPRWLRKILILVICSDEQRTAHKWQHANNANNNNKEKLNSMQNKVHTVF